MYVVRSLETGQGKVIVTRDFGKVSLRERADSGLDNGQGKEGLRCLSG